MKIGFERNTYAEKRQFLGTIADGVEFVRVERSVNEHFPDLLNASERFQSSYIDDARVDAVHYFNQINYGATPFITTYETCAPRYWNRESFLVGCHEVASRKCLKAIAISENARMINESKISVLPDKIKEAIRSKTIVLHPPQKEVPNDRSRFKNIEELRIVFIGRDFYIKGGVPCLLALKILVDAGYRIHLTIVGDVRFINNEYNVAGATNKTVKDVLDFLYENRSWIRWIQNISNEKVLELLSCCHIGLLPSFAETYGYVVLEMQAAGVPVITTDVRAFPEINPDECGWRIRLPKFANDKLNTIVSIIKNSIILILKDVFENFDVLEAKSRASMDRVRRQHSPMRHADVLKEIYFEAV